MKKLIIVVFTMLLLINSVYACDKNNIQINCPSLEQLKEKFSNYMVNKEGWYFAFQSSERNVQKPNAYTKLSVNILVMNEVELICEFKTKTEKGTQVSGTISSVVNGVSATVEGHHFCVQRKDNPFKISDGSDNLNT